MPKKYEKKTVVWERKILRRNFAPKIENLEQRLKGNRELCNVFSSSHIINTVKI